MEKNNKAKKQTNNEMKSINGRIVECRNLAFIVCSTALFRLRLHIPRRSDLKHQWGAIFWSWPSKKTHQLLNFAVNKMCLRIWTKQSSQNVQNSFRQIKLDALDLDIKKGTELNDLISVNYKCQNWFPNIFVSCETDTYLRKCNFLWLFATRITCK